MNNLWIIILISIVSISGFCFFFILKYKNAKEIKDETDEINYLKTKGIYIK